MIKSLRFGVFAQLLVSFVLAIVLTLSVAFIGIYSINSFNDGVEDVVLSRLPALSYAYQLGQQSEAIVATAPLMVRASSQTERETISFRTADRVRTLKETILTIRAYNINADLLEIIDDTRKGLEANFARLDQIIKEELDVTSKINKILQELNSITVSIPVNSNVHASEFRHLIELLLLMNTQKDLLEFENNIEIFKKSFFDLSDRFEKESKNIEILQSIEGHITGDEGLISLHRKYLLLEQRVNGLLAANESLSSRFVYSVNGLIQEMTGDIEKESTLFQEFVDNRTTLLGLVVFICVCSITIIASTRVQSILRRLSLLKRTMNNQASGQDVSIDVSGNDEISDMANALMDLVNKLGLRENDILKNENRFRDLVDISTDWFWETDKELRFTSVSNRFFEITGFQEWDVLGLTRIELMNAHGVFNHPETEIKQHALTIENKKPFRDLTYLMMGKNGQTRLLKISGRPFYSEAHEFLGYRGTGSDITRESLAESRLKAANDIMPGGIALWDDQNRLVMWNLRFQDYYNPIQEFIFKGATFQSLVEKMAQCCSQEQKENYHKERFKYRETPKGFFIEEHVDGRFLQVSEAETNDGGTVTLVVDITERMHSEKRLDQARLDAENANKAKSKFLAAASHDLRQPLHAMGMNLSRLEERRSSSLAHEAVDDLTIIRNISYSLEALGSLMNALLDISKLEAGAMKAEKTDVPLRPLMDLLLQRFSALAIEKGLKIKSVCPDISVYTDPVLIERVLSNLIANAVRYTDQGGVLIGARKRSESVWLEVFDTGIGIAEDQQSDIFIEFKQLKNPARDRRKGLGLGLSIVERVLTLLKHPMQLSSKEDVGTHFRVVVPKGNLQKQSKQENSQNQKILENEKVLIVVIDDQPDILQATISLISGWGYRVIGGASARDVLEQLIKKQVTPDLILADYRLANHQNGADAIETIQEFCHRKIPGVIITGDTAADRIKQAKSSGFLLLHKPLNPAKMRQIIRNMQAGRLK